jgi:hypothetical protein
MATVAGDDAIEDVEMETSAVTDLPTERIKLDASPVPSDDAAAAAGGASTTETPEPEGVELDAKKVGKKEVAAIQGTRPPPSSNP